MTTEHCLLYVQNKKTREQLKEVENEALHHARHFQKLGCGRERHTEFSYQKMVLSIHFHAGASLFINELFS